MALDRKSRRELSALLILLFITAGMTVWIRALTVKSTYRFVTQEKEFRQLEQEAQVLRLQWLKLTAPRKLEALASKIGLEPPKIGQTLKMNDGDEKAKGNF